jgi:dodecin
MLRYQPRDRVPDSYCQGALPRRLRGLSAYGSSIMSVSKVIEITASSKKGIDDAVKHGLGKAAESVKQIKGAWIQDIKVVTKDDGSIVEWRVNMRVNFVVQ